MAADAGELKARATLDNTEFLSALKDMVNQIQSNSQAAADKIDSISGALAKVGETVEGLAIADKIIEFGKDCLDAAIAVDRLHASFIALSGATEATEQTFEAMKELGLHSMFDFADTIGPAAQQMMMLGASAEQTKETMTALVDAASLLKQGPGWLNAVTGAIDNMQSHMVASTRDMRQLSQQGIDSWGDLATALGVTIAQAQKMVKDGAVTSQQVITAVTDDLKSRSDGAAAALGDTWVGAMHTLMATGDEAKESIGNSILKVLNDFAPVINQISALLQDFKTYWEGLSEPVQNAVLAFGAALVIVGAITTALPLLTAALAGVAAIFGSISLPVVAAVAALALIGKWVYDEWPAIKAVFLQLWDDIKAQWTNAWLGIEAWWTGIGQWFQGVVNDFAPVVQFLLNLFSPLIAIWTAEWEAIKAVLGAAWNWISQQVQGIVTVIGKVVSAVVGFFAGMPGQGEMSKLAAAWNTGQQAIAANAAAVAAHTKAVQDNQTATALRIQQQKAQEAQDLANTNAQNAAAKAAKAAADEAAKEAAEQKQYNEDLQKTYNALYAVAPDVAQQFASMYGGIGDAAVAAQKIAGKAWADYDTETQQTIIQTLALGEAFKTLGETSSASLQGSAQKVEDAYTTVANSGTATAGDLAKAFDAVVAANQKVADQMNGAVKDAYTQGKITATDYYDAVVQQAQDAYDKASANLTAGLTSAQDVAAKKKILIDAETAHFNQQQLDYTTAITAIGEKTQEQLSNATDQWNKYAAVIAQKLGTDSKQYIEAQIKLIQSLLDQAKLLANQGDIDKYTAQLKAAQTQLENMSTPAQQFADDMKKLGVNTMQDSLKGVEDMAAALADAKTKSDDTIQSQRDLALATGALQKQVQSIADTYKNQYTQAVKDHQMTQVQADQAAVTGAQQVLQQIATLGNEAPGKMELVNAATKALGEAFHTLQVDTLAATDKAFTDLGANSQKQLDDIKDKAVKDFGIVASQASTDSLTYMNAWINATKKIYDAQLGDGTSLSSAQKEDMGKMVAARDEFLTNQVSAWTTAYGQVKTAVGGAFDDLTKAIVTGDGSFGASMTKLWQSLAETALNAFINPLKTAITNFISHELANLLGDQGLGGVLGSLKNIGSSITNLFSGAGSGLATSASTMGTVGQGIPGVGSLGGAGGGAASAAGSAASGLTGILGAAGSIGSAVTGAIGDIQNIHMEKVMGQVEENTRYSQLYLGGRADQGILGVLFKIDEEIAWGANTKAVENLRDLFKDWSNPMLAWTQGTHDILGSWAPYIGDMKDALFDIRDIAKGLGDTLTTGFAGLTVTINAGNLTTAEAARQLGNQIAANLSTQLVAIKG